MSGERKTCQTLTVVQSLPLAEGIFSLILEYPENAAPKEVRPGQFVGLYPADSSRMLPRPISICGWQEARRQMRLVYRVAGKGTEEFSRLSEGSRLRVLGILGNGYDVEALSGKRVLLLGGGIGAPPMLGLAQALQAANRTGAADRGIAADAVCDVVRGSCSRITSVMGYRTGDLFLTEEFAAAGELIVATDDGSVGYHGNAVDAARSLISDSRYPVSGAAGASSESETGGLEEGSPFDVICACGPLPMLRGVKKFAGELRIPAYLSLEERMACGVGACLGCVTKTVEEDGHSHVHNARVCTEGPVFPAEEVVL